MEKDWGRILIPNSESLNPNISHNLAPMNLVSDLQTECNMQIVKCCKCKKPEFSYLKYHEYRHVASNWSRKQLGLGSVIALALNEASQLGLID